MLQKQPKKWLGKPRWLCQNSIMNKICCSVQGSNEYPVLESNPCIVSGAPFRLDQKKIQRWWENFGLFISTLSRKEQQ